jgi:hypothetical protein
MSGIKRVEERRAVTPTTRTEESETQPHVERVFEMVIFDKGDADTTYLRLRLALKRMLRALDFEVRDIRVPRRQS